MPTTSELIKEVHEELNAVKAADMGMQAIKAFALTAREKLRAGDAGSAEVAIDNLVSLVNGLAEAIPANVIPASAGPVGKSPDEQYLEQARAIVEDSLGKMKDALASVNDTLKAVNDATQYGVTAISALNSPSLKDRAA